MREEVRKANVLNWLLAAASVVVILAGIKAAKTLVVPFLIAAFLAVICTPAIDWLQKKGVPSVLAIVLVIVGVTSVLVLVIGIASTSIADFTTQVPTYQKKLTDRFDKLYDWVDEKIQLVGGTDPNAAEEGLDGPNSLPEAQLEPVLEDRAEEDLDDPNTNTGDPKSEAEKDAKDSEQTKEPAAKPEETDPFKNLFNTPRLLGWFTDFLSGLSSLFSNTLLVLLTLIFILAEASGMPKKLVAITGGRQQLVNESTRVRDAILRYMSLKTVVSLLTGFLAGLLVWMLDVDYPVLWGLIAFFFNYVPNIGSFVAAVPPVLLALIQNDFNCAVLMAIGFGAINGIIGNFVEPRMMGKGLGLSTLVVFLSLVFWGWILGPVGMLLSVPLTMIVKIGLENFDQTRWLAIMLGSNPEPDRK